MVSLAKSMQCKRQKEVLTVPQFTPAVIDLVSRCAAIDGRLVEDSRVVFFVVLDRLKGRRIAEQLPCASSVRYRSSVCQGQDCYGNYE